MCMFAEVLLHAGDPGSHSCSTGYEEAQLRSPMNPKLLSLFLRTQAGKILTIT